MSPISLNGVDKILTLTKMASNFYYNWLMVLFTKTKVLVVNSLGIINCIFVSIDFSNVLYEFSGPRLERECTEAATLGEVKLESGSVVSVPIYAIHRHPDFYPDPETFQPER